jgi:hypothetical protein
VRTALSHVHVVVQAYHGESPGTCCHGKKLEGQVNSGRKQKATLNVVFWQVALPRMTEKLNSKVYSEGEEENVIYI